FLRIGSRNAAPFYSRMTDAVPESEWFLFGGQRMAVLAPDRSYPWQFLVSLPRLIKRRLEPLGIRRDRYEDDVDFRCPERLFPISGAALAGVSQLFRARGHPLSDPRGEAAERTLRRAKGFKPLVGKRDAHPGIG